MDQLVSIKVLACPVCKLRYATDVLDKHMAEAHQSQTTSSG